MDPMELAKQVAEFNKSAFDSTFGTMVKLQDQTETFVNTMIEKVPNMPEEGKKALTDLVGNYKKAREEFKKNIDENYKKATSVLEKK
jgi:polyhydroxyalkanoate synthesis regulator phasin